MKNFPVHSPPAGALPRRRLAGLALAALCPHAVFSQARLRRIGYLHTATAAEGAANLEAFRAGLRDLGYVEGRDIVLELRWADNRYDSLPALANELTQKGVELIVTVGSPGTRAARDARPAVPVVMGMAADPVALGFADSLARPGKSVTGVTSGAEITIKWLDLVRDVMPKASRLAYLINARVRTTVPKLMAEQAARMGLTLEVYEVVAAEELEAAVRSMAGARREVLMLQPDLMITRNAPRIVRAASQERIACVGSAQVARDGGLFGYAANPGLMFRQAAFFVDKILRGARPGDLPIQQAREHELVVNLRTAKALGLVVPQSVLVRATEVIS
ncbi:MAG TPA: ABC transporter substrate-binding protein [Ramlibacter sp.]|jgi:putative ABC transport system substrate-binding protein|nr:ABC transporter substrate-binding protein [Ramlibacter sp.]